MGTLGQSGPCISSLPSKSPFISCRFLALCLCAFLSLGSLPCVDWDVLSLLGLTILLIYFHLFFFDKRVLDHTPRGRAEMAFDKL